MKGIFTVTALVLGLSVLPTQAASTAAPTDKPMKMKVVHKKHHHRHHHARANCNVNNFGCRKIFCNETNSSLCSLPVYQRGMSMHHHHRHHHKHMMHKKMQKKMNKSADKA